MSTEAAKLSLILNWCADCKFGSKNQQGNFNHFSYLKGGLGVMLFYEFQETSAITRHHSAWLG